MKSSLPKVLHPLAGRPLLAHVINTALELQPAAVHVVIGHGAEQVVEELAGFPVNWVIQHEQLGTGHGVLQAVPALSPDSTVLVLYGDVPLTGADTLAALVAAAEDGPALLTAKVGDATGYGRILRDAGGALTGVVEHKDATAQEREITEINTGLLAAPARDLMNYLPRVGNNNKQGEYYLPDILSMAVNEGRTVESCQAASEVEVLGVNDRVQLNQLEREFQRRQAEQLMRASTLR